MNGEPYIEWRKLNNAYKWAALYYTIVWCTRDIGAGKEMLAQNYKLKYGYFRYEYDGDNEANKFLFSPDIHGNALGYRYQMSILLYEWKWNI